MHPNGGMKSFIPIYVRFFCVDFSAMTHSLRSICDAMIDAWIDPRSAILQMLAAEGESCEWLKIQSSAISLNEDCFHASGRVENLG